MDPRFVFAHSVLAGVLSTRGRHEEALATAERGARLSGRDGLSLALLGYTYGAAGRLGDADAVIAEIEQGAPERYVSPFQIALVHVGARRHETAIEYLESSLAARESFFPSMHFDLIFEGLRPMPQFRALLKRMNLDRSAPA
jgi:tetratricopeptide (TPR) repeat protein